MQITGYYVCPNHKVQLQKKKVINGFPTDDFDYVRDPSTNFQGHNFPTFAYVCPGGECVYFLNKENELVQWNDLGE